MSVQDLPEPPPPPDAPRRIRLHPFQWVGVAVLATLPVLALAGTFGESRETTEVSGSEVSAAIRYPTRFRYKQLDQIEVQLRNVSARLIDTVTVSLDTAFATRFSTVRAIPDFARPFDVPVTRLEPGTWRLVIVEIQAERYGSHAGALTISTGGADTLRAPLAIRVFP